MFGKLPYNAMRDFTPISLIVDVPQILVMHPSVPAKTVKDLVALAKARPGHVTIGSAGLGTSAYLSGELFKMMAGVDMPQVIYKGGGPALIGLISGEVSVVFSTTLTAMGNIKTGRIRALGVTTSTRVQALPDVPSISEAGVPGYEASQWFGIFAPAGTPRPIIDRLYQALARASLSPDVKDRLAAQGVEVVNRTPEEFANVIKRETEQWAKVINAAGIQPQ